MKTVRITYCGMDAEGARVTETKNNVSGAEKLGHCGGSNGARAPLLSGASGPHAIMQAGIFSALINERQCG